MKVFVDALEVSSERGFFFCWYAGNTDADH
jgi:hypothetical protein